MHSTRECRLIFTDIYFWSEFHRCLRIYRFLQLRTTAKRDFLFTWKTQKEQKLMIFYTVVFREKTLSPIFRYLTFCPFASTNLFIKSTIILHETCINASPHIHSIGSVVSEAVTANFKCLLWPRHIKAWNKIRTFAISNYVFSKLSCTIRHKGYTKLEY